MNFIVLNNMVYQDLLTKYHEECKEYGIDIGFDIYMQEYFLDRGKLCLLNSCEQENAYTIIGRNGLLYVERSYQNKNCFYAKKLVFPKSGIEKKLLHCITLPGTWEVIQYSEQDRLKKEKIDELPDFLDYMSGGFRENEEFIAQWKEWDLYNQKLIKIAEREEENSESKVKSVSCDILEFTIVLEEWKEQYQPSAKVCFRMKEKNNCYDLGTICEIKKQESCIVVTCEDDALIHSYMRGEKNIQSIYIVDYGKRARLRRQKEALNKLFREETINPNLKGILMGNYPCYIEKEEKTKEEIMQYLERFGENEGQVQAFLGATHASDLYLIQGPPGTGKTTIITEMVKYVVNNGGNVLVSSETNIAVDNVLERVERIGEVLPIRLGREDAMSPLGKKYQQKNCVEGMLEQAKIEQKKYDDSYTALDTFIAETFLEYENKISILDMKIEENRKTLGIGSFSEKLKKDILQFPGMLREVKQLETLCIDAEEKDIALQKEYNEITEELGRCESIINANEDYIFYTGVSEIEKSRKQEKEKYKEQRKVLSTKLQSLSGKIEKNNYQKIKKQYNAKLRKLKRIRHEIEQHFTYKQDFSEFMYIAQRILEKEKNLQREKERLQERKITEIQKAEKLFALLENTKDIRKEWQSIIQGTSVKQELEDIYINKANVVCATCSGIASYENKTFAKKSYDYVIIDEAAKCNTLDVLIPMTMGKKIIMVGDHKQLYPGLEYEAEFTDEERQKLKKNTLFRWLYEQRIDKCCKTMLNVQYRMEKTIAQFISENFYGNKLCSQKEKSEEKDSIIWIDSTGFEEEFVENERGYKNIEEAKLIYRLLKKLDTECVSGTSVGVISLYKSQVHCIARMLANQSFQNILPENNTVDAFQGKEKDIIIFDIVKSRWLSSFANDENRINVAVSRAKNRIFIVGSSFLVKKEKGTALECLYQYIKKNGLIKNPFFIE